MGNPALLIYNPRLQKWVQFPLNRQKITIGRAPENDLVVEDPLVSRQHATLHLDQRGVWIVDLNTPNGVMVNNLRIRPGEWVLLPDGATITLGQTPMRLEMASQHAAAAPPARLHEKAPRKMSWLWLALAGVLMLVCLAAGIAAAWKFYPRLASRDPGSTVQLQNPSPEASAIPTQPASSPPETVETLPVNSGGAAVVDAHGVKLKIPASALASGEPANLESASFSPGMQQALEGAYQIESLAYSVSAASQDGTGRALLSIPAPSADSRLAVLLDNKYAGVLDIEPQNGVLQVNPFLGAPLSESSAPTEAQFIASNRYFVVTPKSATSLRTQGNFQRVGYSLQAGDPDGSSCITEFWLQSHCWRNPESTVYVFWESNVPESLKDTEYLRIIDMIKAVAEIMRAYSQDHHFTNAAISKSNPVYIIIDPSETEPTYSQKTGNVYLNWNVVGSITSQENHCALAHELMHWTEDEVYAMNAAALSNSKAWWLEMGAENGSFLIDPGCIDRNLVTYGRAVTNDNLLPLQSESLVWNRKEGARYIQALQVYVSLCQGGANCALSPEQFVGAINGGTYPFDDSGALAAYQRSAKDMGQYLMGQAPAEANAGAHIIPSTREGGAFAEYIHMKAVPGYAMDVSDNGGQIQTSGSTEASVKAAIAQGGEYPLWISNGRGVPDNARTGYTSLPAMLKIDPGAKLWYMLDSAAPVFHDGNGELTLGPISDKLGTGLIRLVAVAPDAPAAFSARIEPLDLSGDWIAKLNTPSISIVDCPSATDQDEDGFKTDGAGQMELMTIFSMYGSYELDPNVRDGSHLIWQGSFPEGATGESEINIKPDAIEVASRIDIPKPSSTGLLPPWLSPKTGWQSPLPGLPGSRAVSGSALPGSLFAGLLLAFALLALAKWARNTMLASRSGKPWAFMPRTARAFGQVFLTLSLLGCVFWLSGCFGLQFWGSIEGTTTFKKLEYVDPNAPAAEAVSGGEAMEGLKWKLLDGVEQNTFNLNIEITVEDQEGVETSEVEACKFTTNSAAQGFIGPADLAVPPETGD